MNVSTLNAGGLDDQVFAGRSLLASSHRETVEAEVSRTLRPHRLAVLGRGKTLATRMDHLPLGRFSLVRLRYGAPVDVDPGRLDTCYLVSLPTAGHAAFHGGDQFVDTGPGQAGVVSPSAAFRTRMDGQFSQIIFRFERERVEACCAALLGRPVERPIEFALSLPLASQAGQLFSHLRHATLLQAA
ncbi:MAG: putative transcription regulator protein, partial [Rhizobacter sp.]|nr:putative transcription regulator protein [Rhizobacter sp.]